VKILKHKNLASL